MRILAITHLAHAGPGVFGETARAAGHRITEWFAPGDPAPATDGFGAAMVFGGAVHVDQERAHPWLRDEKELLRGLLDRGTPVLGVCLGSQLLAEAAGAAPRALPEAEIGWHAIGLTPEGAADPVLGPLAPGLRGVAWHSYEAPLPPGAVPLARSAACLQAFRLPGPPSASYGIQFHAEVTAGDLGHWLDDWHTDADAVATGLDPEAIRAESAGMIEGWNDVGRGIARRFFELSG
jgi:GMP synthase-like glutamine amidotransferase